MLVAMPRLATPQDEAFVIARVVLDRLMVERGVTEEELGQVLGIRQATVSDKRRGRTNLNLSDIRRAALFFGVSPQVFFEDVNSPSVSSASSEETVLAAA